MALPQSAPWRGGFLTDNTASASQIEAESMSNFGRLLKHLENDSLAARLVRAHGERDPKNPGESLRAVLDARLAQQKKSIDGPAD